MSVVPTRFPVPLPSPDKNPTDREIGFRRTEENLISKSADHHARRALIDVESIFVPQNPVKRLLRDLLQDFQNARTSSDVPGKRTDIREWVPPVLWNSSTNATGSMKRLTQRLVDEFRLWSSGITPPDRRIIRLFLSKLRLHPPNSPNEKRYIYVLVSRAGDHIASTRRVAIANNRIELNIEQIIDVIRDDDTPVSALTFHVIEEIPLSEFENRSSILNSPKSRTSRIHSSMRPYRDTHSILVGKLHLDFATLGTQLGRRRYLQTTLCEGTLSLELTIYMQGWHDIPDLIGSHGLSSSGDRLTKSCPLLGNLFQMNGDRVDILNWLSLNTKFLAIPDSADIVSCICDIPPVERHLNDTVASPPLLTLNEIMLCKYASIPGKAMLLLMALTEEYCGEKQVFLVEIKTPPNVLGIYPLRVIILDDDFKIVDCVDPSSGKHFCDLSEPLLILVSTTKVYVPKRGRASLHDFWFFIAGGDSDFRVCDVPDSAGKTFGSKSQKSLFCEPDSDQHIVEDIRINIKDNLTEFAREYLNSAVFRTTPGATGWTRITSTESYATLEELISDFACENFFVSNILFNVSEYCLDFDIEYVTLIGYYRVTINLHYI